MNSTLKNDRISCVSPDLIRFTSKIVSDISGNILEDEQMSMVESRLVKRMYDLNINHSDEYISYIKMNLESESKYLVSLLTTHHTFFFREFIHFEYIKDNLQDIIETVRMRGDHKIRIWSAASSRGQEVYSLAMLLDYHLPKIAPDLSYCIHGTDIDSESVQYSKNGVYKVSEIDAIPMIYLANNWQKGTGNISDYAKIKAHIKDKCTFDVFNLMEINDVSVSQKYDIILCKNVFIYFDTSTVEKVVEGFKRFLFPEGLLFTGVSESLASMGMKFPNPYQSVYQINQNVSDYMDYTQHNQSQNTLKHKIKVVCVDDSRTVLKLLSKIISEDSRFELVGTAIDGEDAYRVIKDKKPDVVTMDIHMPNLSGNEYLKKYYQNGHPPIVMISSVSRHDQELALKCLELGAKDFVEKPSLNNLIQQKDEILAKLSLVSDSSSFETNQLMSTSSIDKELSHKLQITEHGFKNLAFFYSLGDEVKVLKVVKDCLQFNIRIILFLEGNMLIHDALKTKYHAKLNTTVSLYKEALDSQIVIADLKHDNYLLNRVISEKGVAFIFNSAPRSIDAYFSRKTSNLITSFVEEEYPGLDVQNASLDISPWTSFPYLALKLISGAINK